VLDGSHVHDTLQSDVILEGTQVLFWVILAAVKSGVEWSELRPDRALDTTTSEMTPILVAALLRQNAENWREASSIESSELHVTVALAGQAARSLGVEPADLVKSDLADLRSRPYLTAFFEK
jgi:hypothetical protein